MSVEYMCKTHEEANFLNTEIEKLLKDESGFSKVVFFLGGGFLFASLCYDEVDAS